MFIKVAESIVTFGPIDQFGCLSAAWSVALRISSFDQVRNGPPDAVMMTLVTSSRRPAVSAWNSALCSRIDRQHRRAGLLGAAHEQRAGADQALLVGERERRAALDRGERRLKTGAPVIAPITMSAGRRAASATASEPAAASMPDPESSDFSSS